MTGRASSAVTHAWRTLQARLALDISFSRQIEMLENIRC